VRGACCVASLVLLTNSVVVRTAHVIKHSLRVLGVEGDVVPLASSRSAQKVAETTARGCDSDGLGLWAFGATDLLMRPAVCRRGRGGRRSGTRATGARLFATGWRDVVPMLLGDEGIA
jgi:hypothetical protein